MFYQYFSDTVYWETKSIRRSIIITFTSLMSGPILLLQWRLDLWSTSGYRSDTKKVSNNWVSAELAGYAKVFHLIYDHHVQCNCIVELLSRKNKFHSSTDPVQQLHFSPWKWTTLVPNIETLSFRRSRRNCIFPGSPIINITLSAFSRWCCVQSG